ncbi:hypothetical protein [Nocardia sp. IFM 10818]
MTTSDHPPAEQSDGFETPLVIVDELAAYLSASAAPQKPGGEHISDGAGESLRQRVGTWFPRGDE